MKKDYGKLRSIAIIALIYLISAAVGLVFFKELTEEAINPVLALLCADVLATVIVWTFGLMYENVSVYDPYWSVFPPVAFIVYAYYMHTWTLPVILLIVASLYWGWRLTRNWVITFRGLAYEDWRYLKYRETLHPVLFQLLNFFGLNLMPTLIVFAAMLPGLQLYNAQPPTSNLQPTTLIPLIFGFVVCLASATIQLIADKQIHDFRRQHPGECCNVGLWKRGRHPNYFGEIQFWWGIWVMYASLFGIDWLVCGPIAMTTLFLCISIPLMERRQLENKPDYAEYKKQTRILI